MMEIRQERSGPYPPIMLPEIREMMFDEQKRTAQKYVLFDNILRIAVKTIVCNNYTYYSIQPVGEDAFEFSNFTQYTVDIKYDRECFHIVVVRIITSELIGELQIFYTKGKEKHEYLRPDNPKLRQFFDEVKNMIDTFDGAERNNENE